MKTGKVYLVGAGPGDPGLITRKGLECLAQADVVVHDHLIDERLLDLAPPEAERIYVGKVSSKHVKEQAEINLLLVEKASQGKNVVRLKGGDPFVLGRGGEEAAALAHEHIPFEVVPGISAAVAVPAYAGIPVTHRGMASSFTVVTGHEAPDKSGSSVRWEKLATGADTLVFLMGMQNLPEIVAELRKHGRSPATPVAVIKDGTRAGQKTVSGTLEDIVARVEEHRLGPPAVIVIGDVVRLREKLRWFDNLPLFGKRILVTRARHQASTLSRLLAERGAEPVELPAIDIQSALDTTELDSAIAGLHRYQWLIFTSVNGVVPFFERLHSLKRDTRYLHGLKIGAIGPATAQALEQKGVSPDLCPTVFTSEGLLDSLKEWNIAGKRFLLPRADIAPRQLAEGIVRLGAEAHEVTAYQTTPAADALSKVKELLRSDGIDVITFTSSSTVTNMVAALGQVAVLDNVKIACIGPKTAEAATGAGLKVDIVAPEHTIPGLVTAIEEYYIKDKEA
jgi:uroporphyrinogen III methyltransferase/synthase